MREGEGEHVWPVLCPPPMFRDPPHPPPLPLLHTFADKLVTKLLHQAMDIAVNATWSIPCSQVCHMSGGSSIRRRRSGGRVGTWGGSGGAGGLRLCWTPEQHPYSPCHGGGRVGSSRNSTLSSSHSHNALVDVYTEPVGACADPESDGYAVPVNSSRPPEPIHITLQEVREYLESVYSRQAGQSRSCPPEREVRREPPPAPPPPPLPTRSLKHTLCSVFRLKRIPTPTHCLGRKQKDCGLGNAVANDDIGARLSGHLDPPSPITKPPLSKRALPPLPPRAPTTHNNKKLPIDFATSIQKVKDYGWYWGNISGVVAEKMLQTEPDGSFIVRDSSDDYYIFSLTFKLNSIVRHVRIEHDQGNFSFGNTTRFKSQTIVDFIESAVEHSRSGRYLFFLHRRPVLGPMRVQLLHPVSRFRDVQSLQHMARFVILKCVRRDLIEQLPLPRRLVDYLSTPHYYTEQLLDDSDSASNTLQHSHTCAR